MAKRRHSEEFKREAVKLVTDQGYTMADAARSLGLDASVLRSWKLKYGTEQNGVPKMRETEQEELARLREENRRLRMERDILKKATAFFANEKP
jgi:transposase